MIATHENDMSEPSSSRVIWKESELMKCTHEELTILPIYIYKATNLAATRD